MDWLNQLATRLGILRAEVIGGTALIALALVGLSARLTNDYVSRIELIDKATAEFFMGGEADSLLAAEENLYDQSQTGSAAASDSAGTGDAAIKKPNKKLDLNAATEKELAALPGVSIALADRIVRYRLYKGGRLRSMDDLLNVKGIGERRLQQLKEYLTLE